MASISKLIMIATLVMVISLAVIITLLLLLLAELHFSLFLTRRRHRRLSISTTHISLSPSPSPPLPLRTLFTHGVMFPPAGSDIENLRFLKPIGNTTPSVTARPISPVSESSSNNTWNDLVYISNPMYDNAPVMTVETTPFETPETSPSNLGNHSGEEECGNTPPLTPMMVPEKGCSVSMKDGRFSARSGSEYSNSKNDMSSSSTGSPCTSPSW